MTVTRCDEETGQLFILAYESPEAEGSDFEMRASFLNLLHRVDFRPKATLYLKDELQATVETRRGPSLRCLMGSSDMFKSCSMPKSSGIDFGGHFQAYVPQAKSS